MIVQCPHCGTEIPADKINVQNMVAVCPTCNNVFGFDINKEGSKAKRRKLKPPEKLNVEEDMNSLTLSYKGTLSYEDRAVRSIFGFLGIGLALVFLILIPEPDVPRLALMLLGGFAAFLLYSLLALTFNTTSITIDEEYLRVHQGPIPLRPSTKTLKTDAIMKLDLLRNEAINESSEFRFYYHIIAENIDGRQSTLLRSIPDTYARYIVQQLESHIQGETVPAIAVDTNWLDADVIQDDAAYSVDDGDRFDASESEGHLLD